jgi:hypothetical protein
MIDNFDSTDNSLPGFLPETVDKVRDSTKMLGVSTTVFAKAISKAFTDAAAGGKQFDDVLKQLALRLSGMAVTQAVNPIAKGMAGGLSKLFDGLFAGGGDSSESRRAILWRELRHRAERQGVAADARVAQRLERRNRRGYCSRACGRSENPDCRYL